MQGLNVPNLEPTCGLPLPPSKDRAELQHEVPSPDDTSGQVNVRNRGQQKPPNASTLLTVLQDVPSSSANSELSSAYFIVFASRSN